MSELDEQIAVVEYCGYMHIPVYHIPNEGKRSFAGGATLRRAGLKSGVPDLCIPVARSGKHGLYIELKVGRNKPTESQLGWLRLLAGEGYAVAVCYGADAAIKTIKTYFEGREKDGMD